MTLSLENFTADPAWDDSGPFLEDVSIEGQIDGVRFQRLRARGDKRGELTVLLSNLRQPIDPPPHVYWVSCAPGSIRAWVYHKLQFDRLAFTNGHCRLVLIDIRNHSPTKGQVNVLDVGESNKLTVTIPPLVIHGLHNRGTATATFINMPTNAYDPARPDKFRLAYDHPDAPYSFT